MTELSSKNNGRKLTGLLAILMLAGMECGAATHYIVPPGTAGATPADPYTNWATAGTSIYDVVTAALTNTAPRVVWVTNGTYYPTNGWTGTVALAIQSVNGRDVTIINGTQKNGNERLIAGSAGITITFDGFTVTNFTGNLVGSILSSDSSGSTVKNCSFVNNINTGSSGILFGRFIITNCIFRNNNCIAAGAIYLSDAANIVQGCLFEGNLSQNYIGACDLRNGANVSDCVFLNNRALNGNRGAISIITGVGSRTISNCTFIGNSATTDSGAIYAEKGTIRNCLIASNSASTIGGGIYLAVGTSMVENCTIVSNYAGIAGGGLYVTNSDAAVGTNNIIYHNTAPSAPNYTNAMIGASGLYYTCVIPAVAGTGNITNDPNLVNLGGGNYRLSPNSPCVNRGINQSWMTNAYDLDGQIRIRYGTVDMGAYEHIHSGTIFSFH